MLRCAWRCSVCRCTSHADSWRRRADSMKSRCVSSLALVYPRARWRSTCTTMSASLELYEDCSRMSSKVVSRKRVLMTVEDNCSVSAASRYRRHGGQGRCRSGRHDMTGRNWVFLLPLAIFLPVQTILHPHNVGQPHHVSPHPHPPKPPNACTHQANGHRVGEVGHVGCDYNGSSG